MNNTQRNDFSTSGTAAASATMDAEAQPLLRSDAKSFAKHWLFTPVAGAVVCLLVMLIFIRISSVRNITAAEAIGTGPSGSSGVVTGPNNVIMQVVLTPGLPPSAVRVKLHPEWAPIGVAQFQKLVALHSLDQAAFFRVVPGFIVQFGLPAKPQPSMAPLKDDPVKVGNKRGTLVFATSGPNTRSNQLFINLGDNTGTLDAQGFAPIGEVVEGMGAVDLINPEYGEKPEQGVITSQGNAYLDKEFPRLSKLQVATLH